MIRRLASVLGILALATPLALAQTSTWVPDKAHSEVDFTILHMSLSNVRGHFGNIGGTVVWNDGDITKSTVNVTIDASSIDTGVTARDNDLKSPNFFDAAQFPTATFASTGISKTGGGLQISGNLTLHGVTKPVVLQVQGPKGPITGMDKKPHCGFSGTTTIKRTDFGIGVKVPAAVVGEDVALTFDLDVVKQ
ncbi:MAG: polyisoprenoid-binding protein [Silvibacterium sp.]|nr:polyisoprenoid-binding protein [Silvibacterium sp.]